MQHHHPATKLWHSAETHGTFAATLLPARPSGTLPPPLVSGVHDRNLHAMGSACCASACWGSVLPLLRLPLCVSAAEVKAAGRQIHQQRIALVRGSLPGSVSACATVSYQSCFAADTLSAQGILVPRMSLGGMSRAVYIRGCSWASSVVLYVLLLCYFHSIST